MVLKSISSMADGILKSASASDNIANAVIGVAGYARKHPLRIAGAALTGIGAASLLKHVGNIANLYYNREQLKTMRSQDSRLQQLVNNAINASSNANRVSLLMPEVLS